MHASPPVSCSWPQSQNEGRDSALYPSWKELCSGYHGVICYGCKPSGESLCHRSLGISFSCVTAVLFPLGCSEASPHRPFEPLTTHASPQSWSPT
ncbi:hypothetical protein CEP53_005364 [Fusarium sp. AF-6]|nr:hypothetical protein CEP53_005364 [Fusarium sp. AF-6]